MKLWRLLAVLAIVAGYAAFRLASPYQGFQGEVFVDIPRGTATGAIAGRLAAAGVVRSRWDFLAARLATRRHVVGEMIVHLGIRI